MSLLDRLDETRLHELLRKIPSGTWELMVHPGEIDRGRPFSGSEREVELAALTSATIATAVTELGIRLVSYGDCICASS